MVNERSAHPRPRLELTLGPVLYHWDADRLRTFYRRIADETAIDNVVLGEVICPKRSPFASDALAEAAEYLERAGKRVIHASFALISDDRDWRTACALARTAAELEVNDFAVLAARHGKPFTVGPFLNVYNADTLDWLKELGAERICLVPELDRDRIAALGRVAGITKEVIVFGRLPLALSARCYHARSHGLRKDECRFVCGQDPDGLAVTTLDGQDFVHVNGIATMAAGYVDLTAVVDELVTSGVSAFRLLPQDTDMVTVADLWRRLLDGLLTPAAARAALERIVGCVPLNDGFYHGRAGMRREGDVRDTSHA